MKSCNCMEQPNLFTGDILQSNPPTSYNSLGSAGLPDGGVLTTGSQDIRPKRNRRRRTEEQKSRGRTGTGGGRGLTSAYAAVRLPPLMPPALGLLASDHVFLVRVPSRARFSSRSILIFASIFTTNNAPNCAIHFCCNIIRPNNNSENVYFDVYFNLLRYFSFFRGKIAWSFFQAFKNLRLIINSVERKKKRFRSISHLPFIQWICKIFWKSRLLKIHNKPKKIWVDCKITRVPGKL